MDKMIGKKKTAPKYPPHLHNPKCYCLHYKGYYTKAQERAEWQEEVLEELNEMDN